MLFLLEIIRLGLYNLRLHKLRSTLTSLGIILGVAAVIVVTAIGEGNKRAALRDIQALGATNVIIRSVKPADANNTSQTRSFVASFGIKYADQRMLQESMRDALAIVPLKAVGSETIRGATRIQSQAFGTTPELLEVARLRVEPRGRYLSAEDLESRAPVAVIGSEVAKQLFKLDDPIGADIRIDTQVFRIIGVLKPVGLAGGAGSALVGRDLNKDIHIPLTTAESQFGNVVVRRGSGTFSGEEVELSEIYVVAPNTELVLNVAERVERIMAVGHPQFADVQVIVPWELLENAKKALLTWNIMLIAIAAISLLVGGIGIMNIMLATVTERTREIGIRRALGATRQHITLQFLVETGSLSAVGGVLGIGLGIGVAYGLKYLVPFLLTLEWFRGMATSRLVLEPQVTLWSVAVSFLVAAGVGLIFGIYPAILASRKDPIEALRHD
jgi:putative ABC transport system permease protein